MTSEKHESDKTINVRVLTTSGSYPEHGFDKEPVTRAISAILIKAAGVLGIVDTARWVVRIKEHGQVREVSPTSSYEQLGLHGEVKLDWGPNEAGGG